MTPTDWSGAVSTVQTSVHLGTWTNWSRGSTMGATLTLNRIDGNLLIAFTAVFVSIVTGRLWRIACLIFHRCYSTPEPRDGLHHQRQAVLRNSGSAVSALWTFIQIVWTWQNITSHSIMRAFPAFLTAASCVIAFTIVGGYSSQISSALKNEVLLNSTNCALVLDPLTPDSSSAINPYKSKMVADAAN